MILSDREIQATLTREAAIIEPPPSPKAWSSTAVDLTLDKELRQWVSLSNSNVEAVVCPGNKEYNYSTLVNKHTRIINLAESSHDLLLKQGGNKALTFWPGAGIALTGVEHIDAEGPHLRG